MPSWTVDACGYHHTWCVCWLARRQFASWHQKCFLSPPIGGFCFGQLLIICQWYNNYVCLGPVSINPDWEADWDFISKPFQGRPMVTWHSARQGRGGGGGGWEEQGGKLQVSNSSLLCLWMWSTGKHACNIWSVVHLGFSCCWNCDVVEAHATAANISLELLWALHVAMTKGVNCRTFRPQRFSLATRLVLYISYKWWQPVL